MRDPYKETPDEKKILDGKAIYANRHKRHKIREYLTSLNWDGVRRLDTLLIDYFGAEDSEYVRAATRKTLCAAVARAMHHLCCIFPFKGTH